MYRVWLCGIGLLVGCWGSEPMIDGAFTPAQWAELQKELAPPAVPDPCTGFRDRPTCEIAAELGAQLFADPSLSVGPDPVSCASCHDVNKWFVDTRIPNNVSIAASGVPLPRNAPTIVNVALKDALAPADDADHDMHQVFTWAGKSTHPRDVVAVAALGKPMTSTKTIIANRIRSNGNYVMLYAEVFGPPSSDDGAVFDNVAAAIDAYMRRVNSVDSPFDRYITGDETAISDAAKRGFAVFVGRGTCLECHKGNMFTDYRFHDTGVPQRGPGVPATDNGRSDITKNAMDTGKMLTPSLRNVAMTGPYMHDGSLATLADVIEFYRNGGVADGYTGVRDPRIQPLDLTDDDARDLEAFLDTLTGQPIETGLPDMQGPTGSCPQGLTPCNGTCVDVASDLGNCGGCGQACAMTDQCVGGMCNSACSPGSSLCNGRCTDLANDPSNCGSCGYACAPGALCTGGMCGPTPCPMPMTWCNGTCVDTSSDLGNCGTCGHTCMAACVMGTCAP